MIQAEALQRLTELLPKLQEAQRLFEHAYDNLKALQAEARELHEQATRGKVTLTPH
jgi:hypothetical protein